MKIQIVNVSVAQCAKVVAVLYVVMSLPILAIAIAVGAFGGALGAGGVVAAIVGALVIAPVIYGVFTFLCTGLVAWLYNVVARRVGGLEYSIKELSDAPAKP